MDVDFASYKDLFLQTARDYVGKMEQSLQSLKLDAANQDEVNNMHIAAHSLKSQNFAVGFMTNAELFKTIEEIFYRYKNSSENVQEQLLNDLEVWIEEFKKSLAEIDAVGKEQDLSAHVTAAKKYLEL